MTVNPAAAFVVKFDRVLVCESRSVSEEAPLSPGGSSGGTAQISVHFSVCIEQWRIAEKITGYQKT